MRGIDGNGRLLAAQRCTLRMTAILQQTGPSRNPGNTLPRDPPTAYPERLAETSAGPGGVFRSLAHTGSPGIPHAREPESPIRSKVGETGDGPCTPAVRAAVRRKGKRLVRTNDAFRCLAPGSVTETGMTGVSRRSMEASPKLPRRGFQVGLPGGGGKQKSAPTVREAPTCRTRRSLTLAAGGFGDAERLRLLLRFLAPRQSIRRLDDMPSSASGSLPARRGLVRRGGRPERGSVDPAKALE